jgi:hypothetical protein
VSDFYNINSVFMVFSNQELAICNTTFSASRQSIFLLAAAITGTGSALHGSATAGKMNGCKQVHSITVRLQRRNNSAIAQMVLRACQFGSGAPMRTIEIPVKSHALLRKCGAIDVKFMPVQQIIVVTFTCFYLFKTIRREKGSVRVKLINYVG